MIILTCTGFYGTGSSAVTDIYSDCDNVECKGDFEVRILHDPYGVSDLEYNLIDNPNRHNTSNAIKKFKWFIDFRSSFFSGKTYEKYFQGNFKQISYEFINEICEFKYYGKWHGDLVERGKFFYFLSRSYNKIFDIFKKILHINNEVDHNLLSSKELAYAGTFEEEKFLNATKRYTKRLINVLNKEGKEYVMVDQLVPPTNIKRYSRYVENLKVILVERDPRDLYILEKYYWHGTVIPYNDVKTFCDWYSWTRGQAQKKEEDTDNILKIQFEDLVYKADIMIPMLLKFSGIDLCHYKMEHFRPNESKKNTRLWEKYPNEKENINFIEKELKTYLYAY